MNAKIRKILLLYTLSTLQPKNFNQYLSIASLSSYLREQFSVLLKNKYIDEWISANLEFNERKRVKMITGEMEAFVIK